MIRETACLICGAENLPRASASLAPFIRERCRMDGAGPDLHRLYCPECQFSFFDHRFSQEEVAALYLDYRGAEYNALRERHEPGWGAVAGDHADRANGSHGARILGLAGLMADWGVSPSKVLDYGGETDVWLARGAFPQAQVRGYDISDGSPEPEAHGFDLVLCAHVLEHVSFPVPFVQGLSGLLGPGGLLYLEIPFEDPGLEANLIPGHPLNRMHEHVSFFSARSLERLVAFCGLVPVRIRNFRTPFLKATALLAALPVAAAPSPGPVPVEEPEEMETPIMRPDLAGIHRQALEWAREGTRLVIHPAGSFTMDLLAYPGFRTKVTN